MSDYFKPPHVDDESPIKIPRLEKAGIFARRFQNAAGQFRNPSGKLERLLIGNERYAEYPAGLQEQCGQWIIQANEAGLIPAESKELRQLIAWHAAEEPRGLPHRRGATLARCPLNLFLDVCGGNKITGIFRGKDQCGELVIESSRPSGGLMPRIAGGHLELSHGERCAATCEYLADLILRAATPAPPIEEREEGATDAGDDLDAKILKLSDTNREAYQQYVEAKNSIGHDATWKSLYAWCKAHYKPGSLVRWKQAVNRAKKTLGLNPIKQPPERAPRSAVPRSHFGTFSAS